MGGATIPVTSERISRYSDTGEPLLLRQPRTWGLILIASFICVGTGGLGEQVSSGHLFATSPRAAAESGGIYLLLTLFTWVASIALMARWFRPIAQLMLKQKAVLAFPLLAFVSTLWSSTPENTFRKAVLLFLAFAFGWFLSVAYSPRDQIRLLIAIGVILGLASIPLAVLLPRYGQDAGAGGWKGVFSQKNGLGTMMFFLFSGLPFCRVPSMRRLVVLGLQALLPIGLIVLSQSKESLALAAVIVVARLFGPFITSRRREHLPFLIYAVAFGMAAIGLGYGFVLSLLQRDATLSGRTNEWAILIPFAFRHVWLGYGYQAFWNGSAESLQAMRDLKGAIHGSDSGYVDTILQFGLVGMALWVALFFISLRNIAKAFRKRSLPLAGYWYGGLIIAIFILNFVASSTLTPGNFTAAVLAFSCAGIGKLASNKTADGSPSSLA